MAVPLATTRRGFLRLWFGFRKRYRRGAIHRRGGKSKLAPLASDHAGIEDDAHPNDLAVAVESDVAGAMIPASEGACPDVESSECPESNDSDRSPDQPRETPQRKRRRRKTLVEPLPATWVMVAPGRYVRVEDPAPDPVASSEPTVEVEVEDDSTADDIDPAGETVMEAVTAHDDGSDEVEPAPGIDLSVAVIEDPVADDTSGDGSETANLTEDHMSDHRVES